MKKTTKLCAGMLILAIMLGGCGQVRLPKIIDKTTISINKEGRLTVYLVDEFAKEYYNLSELTEMAVREAAEYNRQYPEQEQAKISVEKADLLPENTDFVRIQYQYDSSKTYSEFNEGDLFYGTVAQALAEKQDLDTILYQVKDHSIFTKEQIEAETGRKLLITNEKAIFYCNGKITHTSEGVVIQDDGSIDTRQSEGNVYILFK